MNSIVIFIVFPILVLLSCKFYKSYKIEDTLSKDVTSSFKGVAVIMIILHHISWKINDEIWLYPYKQINLFAVGLFLFLSGYGISVSYKNKNDYLNGFLKKHIGKIIISFSIAFSLNIIKDIIIFNEVSYNIIHNLITLTIPPSVLWYVKAQVILYLVFYFVFKHNKDNRYNITIVTVPIIIWGIIAIYYKLEPAWYDTLLCFPFGMLVSGNEKNIINMLYKKPVKVILCSISVFILCVVPLYTLNIKGVIYTLFALLCIILWLVFITKVKFKSKLFSLLGNISFELYLIHLIVINLFEKCKVNLNDSYIILVVISLSVILSLFSKMISEKIIRNSISVKMLFLERQINK